MQVSKEKLPKRKIWFYKRADWDGLNIFFKNYDWLQCFKGADANSISRVVTEGMEEYIPSNYVQTIKPKKNAWYDSNCEAVIKTNNLEHRHFLKNPTEENRLIYMRSQNLCNAVSSKAQFTCEQTISKQIIERPKGSSVLWTIAKRVKNSSSSAIPTLIHNDSPMVTALDKANLLATHFANSSTLPPSNTSASK